MTKTRPDWRGTCEKVPTLLKMFVPLEYGAAWFFYAFNTSALIRLTIEVAAAAVLFAGLWGLYLEFQQRDIDRGVRIATLHAQIAQVHALPNEEGLSALKPSLEALAKERVPMHGLNLRKSFLNGAQLRGVILLQTNLSEANLELADLSHSSLYGSSFQRAELSFANLERANLQSVSFSEAKLINANLINANLSGSSAVGKAFERMKFGGSATSLNDADLSGADLSGAYVRNTIFKGANISNTNLQGAKGLTQEQLRSACAKPSMPPKNLPAKLIWDGPSCEN